MQTLGRIHRAEGKTPAIQKFVFCAGTIEEYICIKLRSKLDNLSMINDGVLHPFPNINFDDMNIKSNNLDPTMDEPNINANIVDENMADEYGISNETSKTKSSKSKSTKSKSTKNKKSSEVEHYLNI
jgi:hypothetical protein